MPGSDDCPSEFHNIKSPANPRKYTAMAHNETKSSIQVIERMMRLLATLGQHATPANLKLLATETKLHPSTAHRILAVMVDHRLVDRIEPGTYRLGIRLLELGNLVKSRISVRHEDEVVYIERTSNTNAMMRVVQIVGARAPLHVTAVGKIFLAADGPERSADYARRSGLPRLTENTLTDPEAL